ncbi:PDZ domain-containing protein [Leekyejoonella antrihumi]|nr:PDZ domain-containing protein [Leekyejoonella antrihumi]
MLPTDLSVSDLTYRPIVPAAGVTDLAIWDQTTGGADVTGSVYVLGFDGQTVQVVYQTAGPDMTTKLVGKIPRQQLKLDQEWITAADPQASPARNYTRVIGFNVKAKTFHVVSDNRSWLGVYAVSRNATSASGSATPLIVDQVIAGGPAAGVLQPGDEILNVVGMIPRKNLLGPQVVDELGSLMPGARVTLKIQRDGASITKTVTLSSYANAARSGIDAPSPGSLGVTVQNAAPNSPPGAYIVTVSAGSAAQKAGLADGDTITSLDGSTVTGLNQLVAMDSSHLAGQSVSIQYVDAAGATHQTTAVLQPWPAAETSPEVYGL